MGPKVPGSSTQLAGQDDNAMAVVFFGVSGAGKGTQADLLARHLSAQTPKPSVLRVDQGALLRLRAAQDDELGRRVTAILAAGALVPNFVATGLLADYVSTNFSNACHFIFDGVARYPLQAQMFDELMLFFDRPNYAIIVLELSLEEAKKRLALRGRSDEATEEQTRNRFRWWSEKTVPAIEMLEKKGRKVFRIDGALPVEQVHRAVLQRLDLT